MRRQHAPISGAAVTREEVARRAGVSTATVSYVVNDGPRPVAPKTRRVVLRAIQELGYRPNRNARSLARRQTQSLAFITPDMANPILAELACQIEETAYHAGYLLVVCSSNRDLQRERAQLALLSQKRVDGMLLMTTGIGSDDLRAVVDDTIPVVVLEREINRLTVDMVLVDNVDMGRLATDHLVGHGYQRIACIAGPAAAQRVEGYRQSLLLGHFPTKPELIRITEPTVAGGREAAASMLRLRSRPRAIFASNDQIASGIIHAAHQLGLRVPEDVAVAGADDSYVASLLAPPLTTVALPASELGHLATTLLLDRIHRVAPGLPRQVTLKPRLVVRNSCGCQSDNHMVHA